MISDSSPWLLLLGIWSTLEVAGILVLAVMANVAARREGQ